MRTTTAILLILTGLLSSACSGPAPEQQMEPLVLSALGKLGLGSDALSVPKLPYPVSTQGRLAAVDRAMHDPLSLLPVSRQLLALDTAMPDADYVAGLLEILAQKPPATDTIHFTPPSPVELRAALPDGTAALPPSWRTGSPAAMAVRILIEEAVKARRAWLHNSGDPAPEELEPILAHIEGTLTATGADLDPHRLLPDAYHEAGARFHLNGVNSALIRLLAAVRHSLPALQEENITELSASWDTPLGRVLVAGSGDDTHSGNFLLLIDPGGNDAYRDVTNRVEPGNVSVVIDLSGNDTVEWHRVQGPGAGVLGTGLWLDLAGDDHYRGNSQGLGAALLGTGLFLDGSGNDRYEARTLSLGIGQYGTGIFLDMGGNDDYTAALHSQGYGGPGGIGLLLDRDGNDSYRCTGIFSDPTERRVERHNEEHFINMCQGYAFGLRDEVSGGIGLLLDHRGNDSYSADIFAQGAAYWFGLGLLLDGAGDDRYQAFEHAQGEGLHLAAGILADMAGNDVYTGYEHVQGIGIDRSAGILYEHTGDDSYTARRESQGAGLKSYGVGLLLERHGDDRYEALIDAQGYSGHPEPGFPDSEWPTGILLDLAGTDSFELPYSDPVSEAGRIQNRQGIALDYGNPGSR